jgi:hypothetical protein
VRPPRLATVRLSEYARDVTSQFGEDGILEQVLETLPETDGWCVEFGAWDGKFLSNTYNLIANRGYSAVLIEGSARRFRDLQATHGGNERVHLVNAMVGITERDGLDALLAETPLPRDFDLLSIDIDGADYHVWKAVREYEPKVVIVEYNASIPTALEFVQAADLAVSHGSSIRALVALGKEKEYELVAATHGNAIFVRQRDLALFGIDDNSPEALRPPVAPAYVFQGFDGTLFFPGLTRLSWHGLPINEKRLQQLPRFLRKNPDTYSKLERALFRLYARYYTRGAPRG